MEVLKIAVTDNITSLTAIPFFDVSKNVVLRSCAVEKKNQQTDELQQCAIK